MLSLIITTALDRSTGKTIGPQVGNLSSGPAVDLGWLSSFSKALLSHLENKRSWMKLFVVYFPGLDFRSWSPKGYGTLMETYSSPTYKYFRCFKYLSFFVTATYLNLRICGGIFHLINLGERWNLSSAADVEKSKCSLSHFCWA